VPADRDERLPEETLPSDQPRSLPPGRNHDAEIEAVSKRRLQDLPVVSERWETKGTGVTYTEGSSTR